AWVGEVDFADNNTAIKDFFLSYEGLEGVKLTVGHQKQPYSLAIEMSSNDIPFTERSIDYDAIVPIVDRAIGVRADANGEHWFLAAGFYGDSVEPGDRNTAEGFGTAARFIFSPIISPERVLHLGFRGAYRKPEVGNEGLQFRDETTHMSDYRILSTGTIQDIDDVVLYGPEAAFACGPFSIFGEYNRQVIMRDRGNTLQFEGGHIGATWTLTGESRAAAYRIDSGEFKRLTPKQNFSLKNGGIGAWELAGRYAYQNLNDGSASDPSSIEGGREQVLTFALNWYVNPVVRFMLNYNYVLQADSSGTNAVVAKEGEGLNSFTMRAQVTF
ncbi:MAG TPA: porin, partial [Myxococcota bacterium]|nr:porin [Myxococcota bacterium]